MQFRRRLADQPGADVGGASGCLGHDQAERPRGVVFRARAAKIEAANLHEQMVIHRPEHMEKFVEAMRKAGLPE